MWCDLFLNTKRNTPNKKLTRNIQTFNVSGLTFYQHCIIEKLVHNSWQIGTSWHRMPVEVRFSSVEWPSLVLTVRFAIVKVRLVPLEDRYHIFRFSTIDSSHAFVFYTSQKQLVHNHAQWKFRTLLIARFKLSETRV